MAYRVRFTCGRREWGQVFSAPLKTGEESRMKESYREDGASVTLTPSYAQAVARPSAKH